MSKPQIMHFDRYAKDASQSKQSTEPQNENQADSNSVEASEVTSAKSDKPKEIGGRKGPEPTRYGDWEMKGRCIDF